MVSGVPLGYTRVRQYNRAEKYPNRVGFGLLAYAIQKQTLLGIFLNQLLVVSAAVEEPQDIHPLFCFQRMIDQYKVADYDFAVS